MHPQPPTTRLCRTAPSAPLTAEEIVTCDTLRALARNDAARQQGILSDEDQAILAMVLTDICGELLARRATMRADYERDQAKATKHRDRVLAFASARRNRATVARGVT